MRNPKKNPTKTKGKKKASQAEIISSSQTEPSTRAVWRPDDDAIGEGEELQYDPSAYICLHSFELEWPCLSFDILRHNPETAQAQSPYCFYAVAGSQAAAAKSNLITLYKVANISGKKVMHGESLSSDDDMSDDDEQSLPRLNVRQIAHHGAINRIRSMPQHPSIVATWSEAGHVQVWDLANQLQQLRPDEPAAAKPGRCAPLHLQPHSTEGYALDWSRAAQGHLASGDCQGHLHSWRPTPAGKWQACSAPAICTFVSCMRQAHDNVTSCQGCHIPLTFCESTKALPAQQTPQNSQLTTAPCRHPLQSTSGEPLQVMSGWHLNSLKLLLQVSTTFMGHQASVEDIQWSTSEATVFASCSSDQHICIWDTREQTRPMLKVHAHASDINVISWNPLTTYMLASGAEDGSLRAWDLRELSSGDPVANFTYHRKAIASLEWSPTENSSLAACSADNQLSFWDLALERDPEEEAAMAMAPDTDVPSDLPPQLLFVHCGQENPKELHWHPSIHGLVVSTASNGFNVCMPANI